MSICKRDIKTCFWVLHILAFYTLYIISVSLQKWYCDCIRCKVVSVTYKTVVTLLLHAQKWFQKLFPSQTLRTHRKIHARFYFMKSPCKFMHASVKADSNLKTQAYLSFTCLHILVADVGETLKRKTKLSIFNWVNFGTEQVTHERLMMMFAYSKQHTW